jgi:glycosyltransferase involved in cell wall biosynthesis
MKILIVCQFYYPENFTITKIAESLVKLGNDVTVLTGKPNYGYGYILPSYKNVKYEEINGVKVHRVNLIARKKSRLSIVKNYLSFWRNSKKWVRNCKEKFDIVYSMSLSPVTILSAGNLYKKLHKVPHVVHCVDLWPESVLVTHAIKEKSIFYKILYKWSKDLYSKADKILVGSPSFKDYFKDVLKMRTDHISFVPQPSLIESSDEEKVDLGEGFNILYCGNLGIIQLIEKIPEAMKEVKNKNVKFHVIGMGPKEETLTSLIKEYKLEDKIIYHGPIPAKKAAGYFKGADALYISLKNDGYVGRTLPNKLMMSMVFAKPIIGVLAGDGKDALLTANGGIISDENPTNIAKAIDEMSTLDIETRKKLGENNQVYYQNNYSLEKVSELVNSALKEF